MKNANKYRPFPCINLDDRKWPSQKISQAPLWCSVDLRDGNQALSTPMSIEKKMEMFETLVKCGFKEIEVGFPSASDTDFGFIRALIEGEKIPFDVTIQVLVPAREELIEWTVDSLAGAKKVIIHLYNSTSPAQRRIVFGMDKPAVVKMAVDGAQWVKKYAERLVGTKVSFQYSPESFSATEVEFSLEVCEAVMSVWRPTPQNKIILNLPDTVEVAMPNVYADQIEWFCRNLSQRDSVIVSVHTHNDRGTGIAATEFGLLAGAERVEGTLFGNGERTGNLDIVTAALNLYGQGIDPELDFGRLDEVREVYERCTGMLVPARQPYSGDLVFTAFSGSHQDAIHKGLQLWNTSRINKEKDLIWDVPYLTLDPEDIGRTYGEVIRVNGQSGKAGVAHLLESEGYFLPKEMQREFGPIAKKIIDRLGYEVNAQELQRIFWGEYVRSSSPYKLEGLDMHFGSIFAVRSFLIAKSERVEMVGEGNGPVSAFICSLKNMGKIDADVLEYEEHMLGKGSFANAVAYVRLQFSDGEKYWGVGMEGSLADASIAAIMSALNKYAEQSVL